MPGSFRIGRIAGIDISLHMSWVIIVVLLTWSLATGWFATLYPGWTSSLYWMTSLLAALLLFGSVLAHELAHSLVARARGLPVKNITLFIFGGVSNIEQEPQKPGVEFQMALVVHRASADTSEPPESHRIAACSGPFGYKRGPSCATRGGGCDPVPPHKGYSPVDRPERNEPRGSIQTCQVRCGHVKRQSRVE